MDAVDSIVQQWRTVRTDLDVSPIEVIGRVSRLSRLVDRRLAVNFARHGIEAWIYPTSWRPCVGRVSPTN